MIESELISIRLFLVQVTLKIGQKKYLLLIVLKTNPWTYQIKDLNGEKTMKFLCKRIVVEYIMNYYPEPESHIPDKVKVVLHLSNYATQKELDHATGVDTSDLAAKKDLIGLKTEVDQLDINTLANAPTSLNNLKTKVKDLDVGKVRTVPVDLKKLSDVIDNDVVKNTKFNTLKTKVNNLEKKIPDATTLININQYNKDKQNLQKKIGDVDKKYQIQVVQ